jgi:hypothetical protein
MTKRRIIVLAAMLALCLGLQSCATLEQIANTLVSLQRLKFKLGDVHDFTLMGIRIGGKSRLTDFTAMDGLRLAQAFASRRLPADFILDVVTINPNTGAGGTQKSIVTLTGLESRLLVDNVPTVFGNITGPVEIPGSGRESVLGIRLGLDLFEFFGKQGYNNLINLAMAIGGRDGSSSRLGLDAMPTVSTPFGPLTYPNRITIINREFR